MKVPINNLGSILICAQVFNLHTYQHLSLKLLRMVFKTRAKPEWRD
jgi:hypothetical protein